MKISAAAVMLQVLNFLVNTGEALGQLRETGRGGEELDPLVDVVEPSQLQQTTRYSGGLQEADDNRSKNAGGASGGRRHHNSHGSARRQQHHDCNNNDIAECVELLEVLTNKDLGFAATVDELNKMCPVLLNGLQCIDNYTRRCLTQKHRDYFNKLYAGTIRVIKDLCNTRGRYQEEYIRHAPCMRQVNPKYNVCSVTYHQKTVSLNHMQDASVSLSEDEKNRNVIILCCSFQEYLQCSERVVFETCGNETALFTKEFLDRMAGPIVQGECSQVFNLSLCPRELFPTPPEGLTPSDPSFRPPTPLRDPAATPQHEATTGREDPQLFIPSSPAPPPQASDMLAPTLGKTQRPVSPPPDTPVKGDAGDSAIDFPSMSSTHKMEVSAADRDDAASTVGSRVVLGQSRLVLEAESLHEAACGAAETPRESLREHGPPAAPPLPSTCRPPLLAAAHLLQLVNLPPARAAQHDDTFTNGLTRFPPPSEGLDTNLQSALYSSSFNLSSAYSLPRPRRLSSRHGRRSPAGMPRHVPPAGPSREGRNQTRIRGTIRGGLASPRRRVPPQGGSSRAGLRAANTTRLHWGLRHFRRHFRPPHVRRRHFRRRKPLMARTAAEARQRKNGTDGEVESKPRRPIRPGGTVSLEEATATPQPDEEQETVSETDTVEVTRAEESIANSSVISSTSLEQPRPLPVFPKGAGQAQVPSAIPHPDGRVETRRPGKSSSPAGHPRRHRRPFRRRKFYRNRKLPPEGEESVRGRSGWRRFMGPFGAASRRPTSPTPFDPPGTVVPQSMEEETLSKLDSDVQPPEGAQETSVKVPVDGDDATLSFLPSSITTEEKTEAALPSEQQFSPVPAAAEPPTQEPREAPMATQDSVAETRPEPLPVDVALLTNHTDDPPQNATQEEPRDALTPDDDAHETTDATAEPSSSTTHRVPPPGTPSTTTDDPTRSTDDSGDGEIHRDDADAEADEEDALAVDTGSGENQLPPDDLDLWLQNLFLSELREAVIPAPTPAPYTVRLWQEHDRKEHAKGFFSSFVPLVLDVVESDFVPLTHPATTTIEEDPTSHTFENENSDASDFEFAFKGSEEDFEATRVENVTPPPPPLPPQQQQPSTAAAPAAPRTNLPPSTVSLASHNASQPAGGAAASRSDEETKLRVPPTTTEAEAQRTGDVAMAAKEQEEDDNIIKEENSEDEEEKKGKKKKETKKKKKKNKAKKEREEEEATVPSHKSFQWKKPTTSPSLPQPTTDDLSGKAKVPPAVVVDAKNASSPERSSATQQTANFIPSTSVSPSDSGAAGYSHPPTRQRTGKEQHTHNHTHSHSHTHTHVTQGSLDNYTSSDESDGHEQPSDGKSGAPDRPAATGDSHAAVPEGGDAGAASVVVGLSLLFTLIVAVALHVAVL